jgi:TolA-binding protein
MSTLSVWKRPGLALIALSFALSTAPAPAQNASSAADARIKKLEAEVKALQRQVFPGGDGKFFPPEINKPAGAATTSGTPATTPVTDLLTRMDGVELQLTRITAANEESANRIAQLEAKLAALAPAPAAPAAATTVTVPAGTTAVVSTSAPASTTPATTTPAATSPAATAPAATFPTPAPVTITRPPAASTAKPAAATTTPAAKPAAPSAQRVAAVKAVEKPKTDDAGDDEYSYGYRLWEAKFYPEAEQQLQLFLTKYPRHERVSFARNLLGRAYLDEGKPREAAQWFLKNYQAEKKGARAPDSLLYLAESMRQLKDTNRACIALAEFGETFASEAAGRLKTQYEATRRGVKCS